MKLFELGESLRRIPKSAPGDWRPPIGRRSPRWYLAYPDPVIDLCGARSPLQPIWFCMAGDRSVTEVHGGRTYVFDFCHAPSGIRCGCGTQLAGHDFGDEDRRP